MIEIREITTPDDFNGFVGTESDDVRIIKFSAEWCGPCRVLEGTIKNLDSNKIGSTLFGEVNVDSDDMESVITDYHIRNIPVLIYFKGGKEVKRSVGLVTAETIYNEIESLN